MLNQLFIVKNKINISILIFLIIICIIHYIKPLLIYDENGNFREFGVGYRHKTIVPIWLVVIISAIFSYLFVISYLM